MKSNYYFLKLESPVSVYRIIREKGEKCPRFFRLYTFSDRSEKISVTVIDEGFFVRWKRHYLLFMSRSMDLCRDGDMHKSAESVDSI